MFEGRFKVRKAFFSEEKKQKTFISLALSTIRGRENKSLFASLFVTE
jgi:hypothetical protein